MNCCEKPGQIAIAQSFGVIMCVVYGNSLQFGMHNFCIRARLVWFLVNYLGESPLKLIPSMLPNDNARNRRTTKKQFHDKNDFGAVNYMQIYTWNGSVCCG